MSNFLLLWLSIISLTGVETDQGPLNEKPSHSAPIPGYCGLYCFHSSLKLLGKDVDFSSLVSSRYLSSRSGSSIEDLELAAKDHGLHSAVLRNMNCSMLPMVDTPLLLHVKAKPGAATYNHWILLLHADHSSALVYDGAGKTVQMPMSRIAGIWDGVGIFLSDEPIDTISIYLFFGLAFLALLGFITICMIGARSITPPKLLAQLVHIVLLTFGFVGVLILFSPSRYLTDQDVIQGVRERHVSDLVEHLTAPEVEQLIDSPDTLFVDARLASDYNLGHLQGAVSFPADSTATLDHLNERFGSRDRSKPVVIYCQSAGCNFDEYIGNLFRKAGFQDVRFFVGGWKEWKQHRLETQSGI